MKKYCDCGYPSQLKTGKCYHCDLKEKELRGNSSPFTINTIILVFAFVLTVILIVNALN